MNEDEGYQILTSSLSNKYEGLFGDMFDMVITAYKDRNIVDGRISKTVRKFAFRGTSFVDAGCRIAGEFLPEEIEFAPTEKETAELFVNTINEALRKNSGMNESNYKKEANKEIEELKNRDVEKIKEIEDVEVDIDKMHEVIRNTSKVNDGIKSEIMNFLKGNGLKNLSEMPEENVIEFYKKCVE